MPLLLDALAGNLRKGTIKLRGTQVEARAPSARESLRVRALLDRPSPPLRIPATKGRQAEPEPDFDDLEYQRRVYEWDQALTIIDLAVAIDLDLGDAKPATGPKVYDCNVHGEREAPKAPLAPGFGRFDLSRPDAELKAWIRDALSAMLCLEAAELDAAIVQLRMLGSADAIGEAEKN